MESKRTKLLEIESRGVYQELVGDGHGKMLVNRYKLSVIRLKFWESNIQRKYNSYSYCSMHLKVAMRVNCKCSHHEKEMVIM